MIGEKCPTPGDSLDKNTLKQTESSPSSSASAPAKWIKNDPEENLFIKKKIHLCQGVCSVFLDIGIWKKMLWLFEINQIYPLVLTTNLRFLFSLSRIYRAAKCLFFLFS